MVISPRIAWGIVGDSPTPFVLKNEFKAKCNCNPLKFSTREQVENHIKHMEEDSE